MTCILLGGRTLSEFTWLKWDKSVTSIPEVGNIFKYGSYHLIRPQYYYTDNYRVELTITNVTEDDFGLYTCRVSNHIGTDYNSAFLSKDVKPTAPVESKYH